MLLVVLRLVWHPALLLEVSCLVQKNNWIKLTNEISR